MDFITLLTFLQNNSDIGYIIVFLAALAEFSLFLGIFLPGQSIVIASGFAAALGYFDIVTLLSFVFLGAFIGNTITYNIGIEKNERFILRYTKKLKMNKKKLFIMESYIRKNFGKTMLMGMFNSIIRSFAAFFASKSDVKFFRFLAYNTTVSLTWAVVSVMIGFSLDINYKSITIAFGIISVTTFILLSTVFYNFFKKKLFR